MYTTVEQLQEAARMALQDPEILNLMAEWNNTNDWSEKDQLLCKVMYLVKEKKAAGFVFEDDQSVINVKEYEDSDCSENCEDCNCDAGYDELEDECQDENCK